MKLKNNLRALLWPFRKGKEVDGDVQSGVPKWEQNLYLLGLLILWLLIFLDSKFKHHNLHK